MLLGILMIGICEALNLAVAHGLNPAVIPGIMHSSPSNNRALQVYNPFPGLFEDAAAAKAMRVASPPSHLRRRTRRSTLSNRIQMD